MKIVDTFTATIYVGLREQYTENIYSIKAVEEICQEYCSKIGLCVTVTPTKFIYKDGWENGCAVGLINYPRFPSRQDEIKDKAFNLAEILLNELKQNRVSVVCSDKTYMLEREM